MKIFVGVLICYFLLTLIAIGIMKLMHHLDYNNKRWFCIFKKAVFVRNFPRYWEWRDLSENIRFTLTVIVLPLLLIWNVLVFVLSVVGGLIKLPFGLLAGTQGPFKLSLVDSSVPGKLRLY